MSKNNVMSTITKRCRGEKKRGIRAIDGFRKKLMVPDSAVDGFRKKLMVPDSEIPECSEHEGKIGIIFVNEKILEEYSVKTYEIDPYFYEHYRKKIQIDEYGRECILFRIDVYFTKYFSVVEIDEKGHTDRDLIFEEERQKVLEKKLNCEFIRINKSKEGYDADYEASRIQTFISKFKDKEKENKLEDEIKKLKL